MKRKRDYQKKNFKNPYFPKSQKAKATRHFKIYVFILIILVVVGLYFLNSYDKFKISKIEIRGNERISQQEIKNLVLEQLEQRRCLFFSQSSIFFFKKKALAQELGQQYFLDEIKIKKKHFNTLEVEIKEKISAVIWVSNEDKYFLDLQGVAIRKMTGDEIVIAPGGGDLDIVRSEISSGGYPVVYDQDNKLVVIGQMVADQAMIDFVVNLTEELAEGADFDISHYNFNQITEEIILITQEGWEARFKISNSAQQQADSLLSVLYQKVKNRSSLEYIDLRFGDKVFWK